MFNRLLEEEYIELFIKINVYKGKTRILRHPLCWCKETMFKHLKYKRTTPFSWGISDWGGAQTWSEKEFGQWFVPSEWRQEEGSKKQVNVKFGNKRDMWQYLKLEKVWGFNLNKVTERILSNKGTFLMTDHLGYNLKIITETVSSF